MSDFFKIKFEWLHREYGDAEERATLADLTIVVNGNLVTNVEDLLAKTVRKSARLSALYLARWLAGNWWRLRWEPEETSSSWQMSHKIGAAGGGYVWPDLAFCGDGETIFVRTRPTPSAEAQPIRYLSDFDEPIPSRDFERGVDDFIEATIARLSSNLLKGSELTLLWKEILDERRDPEAARWRKLEAFMGFDPDEAPADLIETLQKEADLYGKNAIEEMAAASKDKAPSHIRMLWEDARPKSVLGSLSNIEKLRSRTMEVPPSRIPWQRAEQVARIARDAWSSGPGPVKTETLCDIFELPSFLMKELNGVINIPVSASFLDGGAGGEFRVFWNKPHPSARRFGLARLVGGNLVAQDTEKLLPATGAKTSCQKFQRAFAQEFLCPFDDLMMWLNTEQPSDEDIEEAADHFDVSPLLIKTTLVNRGILEREALGA